MKVILSLSGGMDSTALLGMLLNKGHEVVPVSFFYGSKHGRYEIEAAKNITQHYNLGNIYKLIDVSGVFKGFDSALLSADSRSIPEGHYEDKSMALTVVPGRNMIFISILAGLAESLQCEAVALGIHAGDHAIYPDCRPLFAESMGFAVRFATDDKVRLIFPFLNMTKGEIVSVGLTENVPFHLTRTCYKDQILPCGKCGSCTERLEAFQFNNSTDPVQYDNNIS
jgi:7-cyano-7-deazaguanine synthase